MVEGMTPTGGDYVLIEGADSNNHCFDPPTKWIRDLQCIIKFETLKTKMQRNISRKLASFECIQLQALFLEQSPRHILGNLYKRKTVINPTSNAIPFLAGTQNTLSQSKSAALIGRFMSRTYIRLSQHSGRLLSLAT